MDIKTEPSHCPRLVTYTLSMVVGLFSLYSGLIISLKTEPFFSNLCSQESDSLLGRISCDEYNSTLSLYFKKCLHGNYILNDYIKESLATVTPKICFPRLEIFTDPESLEREILKINQLSSTCLEKEGFFKMANRLYSECLPSNWCVTTTIVDVFSEEVICRGLIQRILLPFLANRLPSRVNTIANHAFPRIVVTSIIFSLTHYHFWGYPDVLLSHFFKGIVYGALTEMSDSILPATIAHSVNNLMVQHHIFDDCRAAESVFSKHLPLLYKKCVSVLET